MLFGGPRAGACKVPGKAAHCWGRLQAGRAVAGREILSTPQAPFSSAAVQQKGQACQLHSQLRDASLPRQQQLHPCCQQGRYQYPSLPDMKQHSRPLTVSAGSFSRAPLAARLKDPAAKGAHRERRLGFAIASYASRRKSLCASNSRHPLEGLPHRHEATRPHPSQDPQHTQRYCSRLLQNSRNSFVHACSIGRGFPSWHMTCQTHYPALLNFVACGPMHCRGSVD